jgi:hypothetical protein
MKSKLKQRMRDYMDRAEKVKEYMQAQKEGNGFLLAVVTLFF